jgi:hypothetical protein
MAANPPMEYERFTELVDSVISVPRAEIERREAEYRRQVEANPNRRGPKAGTKRKTKKSSVSHGPAAETLS